MQKKANGYHIFPYTYVHILRLLCVIVFCQITVLSGSVCREIVNYSVSTQFGWFGVVTLYC